MDKKRLVHHKVVLNLIKICVKAKMMRSYLMKKVEKTGGKPTFKVL